MRVHTSMNTLRRNLREHTCAIKLARAQLARENLHKHISRENLDKKTWTSTLARAQARATTPALAREIKVIFQGGVAGDSPLCQNWRLSLFRFLRARYALHGSAWSQCKTKNCFYFSDFCYFCFCPKQGSSVENSWIPQIRF